MTLGSFVLRFFYKNLDAGSGHQYENGFSRVTVFSLGGGGRGGTPYIYVRISLVTVYGNVGKSVISVCKEA